MKRKIDIVYRGGSLIFAWMEATGNETHSSNIMMKSSISVMNMT